MRKQLSVAILGLSLLGAGQAMASSSSYTIRITAHVDPFCKVTLDQAPLAEKELNIVNGAAQIGVVHEMCNTVGGYEVMARFTNLSGGELNVAGRNYAIDSSGSSVRRSDNPMVQDLNWQIADASIVEPSVPVLMRVTISPR